MQQTKDALDGHFLNQPLKTAGEGIAENSGAMLIQTGRGSSGDSGSLILATGTSDSCGAGDMAAIVGPIDSATGGGAFTVVSGSACNVVVTAGAAGFPTVSEREYQSKYF